MIMLRESEREIIFDQHTNNNFTHLCWTIQKKVVSFSGVMAGHCIRQEIKKSVNSPMVKLFVLINALYHKNMHT